MIDAQGSEEREPGPGDIKRSIAIDKTFMALLKDSRPESEISVVILLPLLSM
jgi:hypothetical protein